MQTRKLIGIPTTYSRVHRERKYTFYIEIHPDKQRGEFMESNKT